MATAHPELAPPTSDLSLSGLDAPIEVPPAPAPHPLRLGRVLQLLRSVDDDAGRTLDALELFDAVGGQSGERVFQRFVRDPRGRRLIREGSRLELVLADRERLAAMPEGSLGRAYLAFAQANGFAADGLVELNRNVERESGCEDDPIRSWFWDRYTMAHDLWHVMTGSATDEDGEALLLSFSNAQTPQRGYAFLLALIRFNTKLDLGFHRKLSAARRAGARAEPLIFARWEEWLERPIDELRRELRVPVLER